MVNPVSICSTITNAFCSASPPAAGTAGFLIAAHEYIKSQTDDLYDLTTAQKAFQATKAYTGIELVPGTRRLALMNCLLAQQRRLPLN